MENEKTEETSGLSKDSVLKEEAGPGESKSIFKSLGVGVLIFLRLLWLIPTKGLKYVFILLIIFGAGFTVLEQFDLAAPTAVVTGKQMSQGYKDTLRQNNLLKEDEKPIYFYSTALFDILEDGNMLTDKRVVSYFIDEGDTDITVFALKYEDITEMQIMQEGDFLNDTMIYIYAKEEENDFFLLFSAEDGGDKKVLNYLKSRLEALNIPWKKELVDFDATAEEE